MGRGWGGPALCLMDLRHECADCDGRQLIALIRPSSAFSFMARNERSLFMEDHLLPTPPSAPPEWSLIDHANDAFDNDKAGNLKGAAEGYLAVAESLQSRLRVAENVPEAAASEAAKAIRARMIQYVERAEAVHKRMHQRKVQYETRTARQHDPIDPNVFFYKNEIRSQPNGDYIEEILGWYGDWEKLEEHHGYIQWLFPFFDPRGHNALATSLSKSGAKIIREDPTCQWRVFRAYKMMLHFYGFRLADEQTGRLERIPDEREFRERIDNFNKRFHNCLRVSRILVSLGELGFRRYKIPFVERLQAEIDAGTYTCEVKKAVAAYTYTDLSGPLTDFWRPLVYEEATEEYKKRTLEEPEDRAEGCLFGPNGALDSPIGSSFMHLNAHLPMKCERRMRQQRVAPAAPQPSPSPPPVERKLSSEVQRM